MSCNICGKTHREKSCPTDYVVITTTEDPILCPPIPLCQDFLETHCVYYSGPDIPCAGITNGDDVNTVIQNLLDQLGNCCLPATTTTTTSSTTTTSTSTTSTTTTTTLCPIKYLICCSSYNSRELQIIEAPCDLPDITFKPWEVYQDNTTSQSLGTSFMWVVATQAEIVELGYTGSNITYVPNWTLIAWASAGFGSLEDSLINCNSLIRPSSICPEPIIPTTTTSTTSTTSTTTSTTSTTSTTTSTTSTTTSTTTTTTIPLEEVIIKANLITKFAFSSFSTGNSVDIDFGPLTITFPAGSNQTNVGHTYATPYTGDIVIRSVNLSTITRMDIAANTTTPSVINYILPVRVGSAINPTGFAAYIDGTELAKLDGLTRLSLNNSSFLVNDTTTSQFANTLSFIDILNADVSGNISDLPDAVPIAKSGNVSLNNYTTVTGDLSGMPASYKSIQIVGGNTISGNIGGLQEHVESFSVLGANTLTGDVTTIPNSYSSINGVTNCKLTSFNVQGYNTLSGNIREFDIARMKLLSITGEIDILTGLGGNTITGTISANGGDSRSWNTALSTLQVLGKNTISGNLSALSGCTSLTRISIDGKLGTSAGNTLQGDLSSLPVTGGPGVNTSLDRLILAGDNTVKGSLSDITNFSKLRTIVLTGQSETAGNLSQLPTSTYVLSIDGISNIGSYPTQREKGALDNFKLSKFAVIPTNFVTGAMTAVDLERLLIDLNTVVTSSTSRTWERAETIIYANITLTGDQLGMTGAGDAALASLQAKLAALPGGAINNFVTITQYP